MKKHNYNKSIMRVSICIFSLLFWCIFTGCNSKQETETSKINNVVKRDSNQGIKISDNTIDTIKNLMDSTMFSKESRKILLLETDSYIIQTTYELFIYTCVKFIKENKIEEDKYLLKLFINNRSRSINAKKLVNNWKIKERLKFRIADLIESGDCILYNKTNKHLERIILKNNFSRSQIYGRQFITIDKHLILETVDAIE